MEIDILDDCRGFNNASENCLLNGSFEECESLSNFSVPMSPTPTEKSSKSAFALSEHGIKTLNDLKSESPIVQSSKSSVIVSPKSMNSLSGGKRRTESKSDHFDRNPITSERNERMSRCSNYTAAKEKNTESEIDSRDINRKCPGSIKSVYESLYLKDFKKSYIRRNPITGEGMPDSNDQINMKNLLRSGLRIKQPPGGLSSGIF